MKNINARVQVDVRNLRTKLTTFQARQLCPFRAEIVGVPQDVEAVACVLYKPNGEHFPPLPANQNANGDWEVLLLPTQFPDAGEAKYELVATDADSMTSALGEGKVVIDPFGSGGTAIPIGKEIPVTEITDQNGVAHRIKAVNTAKEGEEPNWTSIVEV